MPIEITASQLNRLRKAHRELTTALTELGALQDAPGAPAPQWKTDTEKQWRLLKALADLGGDLVAYRWGELGTQHGYDPRGLGGFFRGAEPLMASQGARRVLTTHGRRFVERWEADFGSPT